MAPLFTRTNLVEVCPNLTRFEHGRAYNIEADRCRRFLRRSPSTRRPDWIAWGVNPVYKEAQIYIGEAVMKLSIHCLTLILAFGLTACSKGKKANQPATGKPALKTNAKSKGAGQNASMPKKIIAPAVLKRMNKDNGRSRPVLNAKTLRNLKRSNQVVQKIKQRKSLTKAKVTQTAILAMRQLKCSKECQKRPLKARPACLKTCVKKAP